MNRPTPHDGPRAAAIAAALLLALSAQAPTPPATTSSDCPIPASDTKRFLMAPTYAVGSPHGQLALVAVRTMATRDRGLMCVQRVPRARGMLFVFPPPDRIQGFWMKNTLVALDMVFVTAGGTVSGVAANIPPTPRGTPDTAVARREGVGSFVIELAAGQAARHGIVRGTKLALPALPAAE